VISRVSIAKSRDIMCQCATGRRSVNAVSQFPPFASIYPTRVVSDSARISLSTRDFGRTVPLEGGSFSLCPSATCDVALSGRLFITHVGGKRLLRDLWPRRLARRRSESRRDGERREPLREENSFPRSMGDDASVRAFSLSLSLSLSLFRETSRERRA